MKTSLNSKSGFTLIEVIAVLVLLGILAAVAVPKYVDLTANAAARAVDAAVAELNGREALTWANVKLSSDGWVDDATTFDLVDTTLNTGATTTPYAWDEPPTVTGGNLIFDGNPPVTLTRTASTTNSPGVWK